MKYILYHKITLFYCETEHLCLYYVAGEEMDHGSKL